MGESTVYSAISLSIKRLDEEIERLPPFSASKALLVQERNNLIDSRRRIESVLDPRPAA